MRPTRTGNPRPLNGKLVVLTRSRRGNRQWRTALAAAGAQVYSLPTITTTSLEPDDALRATLVSINTYDWIIFTSTNGIKYFWELCDRLNVKIGAKIHSKVAVIGPRTAARARASGLEVSFVPSVADSRHLADELGDLDGRRVLILRTTIASKVLPDSLRRRGATVDDRRIYRTVLIRSVDRRLGQLLADGRVNFLIFASPSAVQGTAERLSTADLKLAQLLPAVAIGPSVVQALAAAGFKTVHVTDRPSIESVIDCLEKLAA